MSFHHTSDIKCPILWPHRRWAIFSLPEVLEASRDENTADIKSAYLLGLWNRHEEGRQHLSKGNEMIWPGRHKSRKRKAEKEALAKARKKKSPTDSRLRLPVV